ncbi:Hypothetical protein BN2458_PEG1441 [Helicobacter typhlonius]|uniref:Uncharacterized protein n=1 Tax=Helicobacter typhlonius TaxID=76936 RepID=A0A0S4PY25_9HELI|nr:Hypothetical protein BN2458_PEG1441 [Helicobacter typhlonius]
MWLCGFATALNHSPYDFIIILRIIAIYPRFLNAFTCALSLLFLLVFKDCLS